MRDQAEVRVHVQTRRARLDQFASVEGGTDEVPEELVVDAYGDMPSVNGSSDDEYAEWD